MGMKYMKMLQINSDNIKNTSRQYFCIIYKNKGGAFMFKLLAKVAEKYARTTNTACFFWAMFHQPKMPASLVKKD